MLNTQNFDIGPDNLAITCYLFSSYKESDTAAVDLKWHSFAVTSSGPHRLPLAVNNEL